MVCGRGGIGRRAGFKIPFLWSVGSIPTARTKIYRLILFALLIAPRHLAGHIFALWIGDGDAQ